MVKTTTQLIKQIPPSRALFFGSLIILTFLLSNPTYYPILAIGLFISLSLQLFGWKAGIITILLFGIYFGEWIRLPMGLAPYNISLALILIMLISFRNEMNKLAYLKEIKQYFVWIFLITIFHSISQSPIIFVKHVFLYSIAPYIVYLTVNNYDIDIKWIRKVILGLLLVFTIEAIVILLQMYLDSAYLTGGIGVIPERVVSHSARGWSEWFGGESDFNYVKGIYGTFSTANIAGQFLDFGAAFSVLLFLSGAHRSLGISRLLLFGTSAIISLALINTYSRGSVLGFIIIITSYIYWRISLPKSLKLAGAIIALFLLTVFGFRYDIFSLVFSGLSGGGILGRILVWSNSVRILLLDPFKSLIGMGILDYQVLNKSAGGIIGHNAVLVEMMVNGLVSGILFVRFLIAWFFKEIIPNGRPFDYYKNHADFPLFLALFGGLSVVLLHMITSSMWGSNMFKMVFFLYIGILAALRRTFSHLKA